MQDLNTLQIFSCVLDISTELSLTFHFQSWKCNEHLLSFHEILFSLIPVDVKTGECNRKLVCKKQITSRNVI